MPLYILSLSILTSFLVKERGILKFGTYYSVYSTVLISYAGVTLGRILLISSNNYANAFSLLNSIANKSSFSLSLRSPTFNTRIRLYIRRDLRGISKNLGVKYLS